MHVDLTITPKPFKSSNLGIPHSPLSPQFPITPPATPPQRSHSIETTAASTRLDFVPPPPQEPLHWLWQCHICNRCYRLGVTRRCLDDGHYFCSGTTTVKRSKKTGNRKIVRHKACASEFDYQAWKTWGEWRRGFVEQVEAAAALERLLDGGGLPITMPRMASWSASVKMSSGVKKDCWNTCDYPSECRWGKQYAVDTPPMNSPAATVVTVPSWPPAIIPETPEPATSFDDIVLSLQPQDQTSVDWLESASLTPLTSPEEETKKPSMDDLLESAKRRKRRSTGFVASPLASNPPSPVPTTISEPASASSSTAHALQKAFDDFELDFRKSFGRAGAFVSSVVNKRNTAVAPALEDDKGVVRSLRVARRKSGASFS